jgi:hypothetical protein
MKKNNARSALPSVEAYQKEAHRYYKNAKEILSKTRIEYNRYVDAKPVQESSGAAYLAMLKAIDGFLIENGVRADELPTSAAEYQKALKRSSARNGKVLAAFNTGYENLHILGYYRGGLNVQMIKAGFESVRFVIEKLSGKRP